MSKNNEDELASAVEDARNSARGIVNGCVIAMVFWGFIIAAVILGWLIAKGM